MFIIYLSFIFYIYYIIYFYSLTTYKSGSLSRFLSPCFRSQKRKPKVRYELFKWVITCARLNDALLNCAKCTMQKSSGMSQQEILTSQSDCMKMVASVTFANKQQGDGAGLSLDSLRHIRYSQEIEQGKDANTAQKMLQNEMICLSMHIPWSMGQNNNLGVSCRVLLDSFWILSRIQKIIIVFYCANLLKKKLKYLWQ